MIKEGYKETSIGVIPNNWKVINIGDIGKVITGSTPKTSVKEYYSKNGFLWASPADLGKSKYISATNKKLSDLGFKQTRKLPPNSILITCIGSTIGKIGMAKELMSSNQQINSIVSFDKNDPEFYYYVLESMSSFIKFLAGTQAVPLINKSDFSSIKVVNPPLPEQQKIAKILSTVDVKLENISQQIQTTEQLKKGLMQQLLSGKFNVLENRPYTNEELKDSPLGKISKEWEIVKFNDILIDDKKALGYGILQPGEGVDDGVPMLRTVDLTDRGRADTTILKVPKNISDTSLNTILEGNEVLISVMGTLGRAIVVPKEWKGWNVNRALAVVRVNEKIDRYFLFHIFQSPYFKLLIDRESLGSAQMRINLNNLRKFAILLPKIEEQQKITNMLSVVNIKIEQLYTKKAHYIQLKKGLMQQLLTGKIRVKV